MFVEHKLSVTFVQNSICYVDKIILNIPCDFVYRKIQIIFPTYGALENCKMDFYKSISLA